MESESVDSGKVLNTTERIIYCAVVPLSIVHIAIGLMLRYSNWMLLPTAMFGSSQVALFDVLFSLYFATFALFVCDIAAIAAAALAVIAPWRYWWSAFLGGMLATVLGMLTGSFIVWLLVGVLEQRR